MLRRVVLLLALGACNERDVHIVAPGATKIEISTGRYLAGDVCEVSATVVVPSVIVPVLVPMPMPYERQPVKAEKE